MVVKAVFGGSEGTVAQVRETNNLVLTSRRHAWPSRPRSVDNASCLLSTSDKTFHYENMPIQIYRKFYHQKIKLIDKKTDIFNISAQNIDCGYTVEPPRRGGSNESPQSLFSSKIRKNTEYYIKVGFKAVKII